MGRASSNMTNALIRRDYDTDTWREDPVKIHAEDSLLQTTEKGLRRNQPYQHLDLRLLASRTMRK